MYVIDGFKAKPTLELDLVLDLEVYQYQTISDFLLFRIDLRLVEWQH